MVAPYFDAFGIRKACKEEKSKKNLNFLERILEMFLKSYILRTQFVHILYLVNGNHSFTLFPFYLINIFITKLLGKSSIAKGIGALSSLFYKYIFAMETIVGKIVTI